MKITSITPTMTPRIPVPLLPSAIVRSFDLLKNYSHTIAKRFQRFRRPLLRVSCKEIGPPN
jgi:hypothetical protein